MSVTEDIHRNYGDSGDPDRWKVDEVIECLEISDEIRDRLMTVAPGAYQRDGIYLADVWPQLAPEEQAQIEAAYNEEAL